MCRVQLLTRVFMRGWIELSCSCFDLTEGDMQLTVSTIVLAV